MILDFAQSGIGPLLEADVCVIGGGPAGIAFAREFESSHHSVIVLESGGLEINSKVQALHKGTNTRGDFALDASRFRLLGGTSCTWGGWCAPLDEIDFERREWVPDSGWPLT